MYSDIAVEKVRTLKLLFKLPLRQEEGFLKFSFRLVNIEPYVPSHATLFHRDSSLMTQLKRFKKPSKKLHIATDNAGHFYQGESD